MQLEDKLAILADSAKYDVAEGPAGARGLYLPVICR